MTSTTTSSSPPNWSPRTPTNTWTSIPTIVFLEVGGAYSSAAICQHCWGPQSRTITCTQCPTSQQLYKEWALDVTPLRRNKRVTTTDKTINESTRPMSGLRRPIYRAYLSSCHRTTSPTKSTCLTSPAIPSAQCWYTPRTKPPRGNCAAPSTTSRVTMTPTRPTFGRRRDPSAFGPRNTVNLIDRLE